jgi:O-methyltransferase
VEVFVFPDHGDAPGVTMPEPRNTTVPASSAATPETIYAEVGLGALPASASAADLYIDLVKRAVINVLYEDHAVWYFDDDYNRVMDNRFDLRRRLQGMDLPNEAHTMVGLERLNHLQTCAERAIRDGVPGDFVEAGVLRGGAAILLRAILKAHAVTDRRVVACDTFMARKPMPTGLGFRAGLRVLRLLATIRNRAWRRRLFFALQKRLGDQRSFPVVSDPSDQMVDGTMFMVRNLDVMQAPRDRTSLAAVRSHFARYGLLDDQVLFLEGFFSETLPKAGLTRVAILRLDGDTYESTRDVLETTYAKLADGGFCVIDDYYSFPDCKRAVDEYRAQHGIVDTIHKIDKHAVYWRRGH